MAVVEGSAAATKITRPAGEDMSSKQFHLVKLNGANVDLCDAITDIPIGVVQNAPASGEMAEVVVIGATKVEVGADLAAGAAFGCAADAQAVAAVTTMYVVGQLLSDPGAAGEIASAVVNCASPSVVA